MLTIAIDAMGGDFGPQPIVEGTLQALEEVRFKVKLVGDEEVLKPMIPSTYDELIEIVHASEVFGMHEIASSALKRKDTSIYVATELVKEKRADALVSAGHSGATMSLATIKIGRIKGVSRPAIATMMPTTNGQSALLLDVGANVDCKAENLFQFAVMGECYVQDALKKENPKVGLLSNGEEDNKGNEVGKEAFKLLKQLSYFVGNVEGNNIFDESVDVIVCDGFTGNIVIKTSEGVAESISTIIKKNVKQSPVAIAGSILMNKVFKILKTHVDYAEYGGAPLIGVNGSVIVSHGKSNSKAIKNAIFQAIRFAESNTNKDIEEQLKKFSNEEK